MKDSRAALRATLTLVCCAFVCSCSSTEVRDAGKQFGASALEQIFILAAFGPDALERHNEKEYREWYWSTTPYRKSATQDDIIKMQEKIEFQRIYDELMVRESKYLLASEQVVESEQAPTEVNAPGNARDVESTKQSDNR